jgi:hypothetical protein
VRRQVENVEDPSKTPKNKGLQPLSIADPTHPVKKTQQPRHISGVAHLRPSFIEPKVGIERSSTFAGCPSPQQIPGPARIAPLDCPTGV